MKKARLALEAMIFGSFLMATVASAHPCAPADPGTCNPGNDMCQAQCETMHPGAVCAGGCSPTGCGYIALELIPTAPGQFCVCAVDTSTANPVGTNCG